MAKLVIVGVLAILGTWIRGEFVLPAPIVARSYSVSYRGATIAVDENSSGTRATVAATGETYASLQAARVAVNTAKFIARTGIRSRAVIELYALADRNRNGDIDWPEIERFQTELMRSYNYKSNQTALRPDEFLQQGGGDCEDFALLTAGLLRFWGVPVAVASVQSAAGYHAIALVETTRVPAGYTHLRVTDKTRGEINYVPIDYDNVGRFSSAVAREYTVSNIWIPEEIYGWRI
jgi:hypothetical protein